MTRILIIGGYGFTGKLIARHLMEESGVEIVIAARHVDKAKAFVDDLNSEFAGSRASAVHADAAEAKSLRDALDGIDIMVVAAPTTKYSDIVIETALDHGTDYLDIQVSARKLSLLKSLSSEIEERGLCFITEAGFHPGLPSAMVMYAARLFERFKTAEVAGYLNMGKNLPFTEAVDEVMEIFKSYQTHTFRDGKWTEQGGFKSHKVNFGGEIGTRNCYPMFFEEMRDLPAMYPTLTCTGFYMSGTNWFVDWLLTPVVLVGLKVAPIKAVRPMGKLLWWGWRTFSRPPCLCLVRVEATGTRDGGTQSIIATVSHRDGYELTAIPVVATLLQYLDGSARKPGLWMMGHLAEPTRLFNDMRKMGVTVTASMNSKQVDRDD